MSTIKARVFVPVFIISILLLFTTACSGRSLMGTINVSGSTTVRPIAERIADMFMQQYPDVNVIVRGGGSSTGVQNVSSGVVDIGAASRELKDDEPNLVKHLLGRDGIAIVVHPSNEVSNLSNDVLIDIFTGRATSWNTVGGSAVDILVVSREEGSGTRTSFEEMVMGDAVLTGEAVLEPSNDAVRTLVSTSPNAIGFLSMGFIDRTVKVLDIDGTPCSIENCCLGVYPFVRSLYYLTPHEPQGLIKSFIDYSLGPVGQEIVKEEGYMSAE